MTAYKELPPSPFEEGLNYAYIHSISLKKGQASAL